MTKRIFLVLPLILLNYLIKAQVNINDSLALVDLYNNTGGSSWKNNTNWLSGNVSNWYGVTVTGNRVTRLYLVNNGLNGHIPQSFSNLSGIVDIFLSQNKLTGTIPNDLTNLSKLYSIYLNDNHLEGSIPTFSLVYNITLNIIHLENNQLSGEIPRSLRYLRTITDLNLSNNKLSGSIPGEIVGTILYDLDLSYNNLSGPVPDSLKNFKNLRTVKLNNNNLSGTIPNGLLSGICNSIDLSSNHLTGNIPADLTNNGSITQVILSNNQLSGQIPTGIGNLTGLQVLNLDNNQLSGSIPVSLKNLSRLTSLYLNNNQFTGAIPHGLCNLPDLQELDLSNNQFTFDGMECVGQKDNSSVLTQYDYQDQRILTLNFHDTKLSLNAGGTLSNNTYYVYKDSVLLKTVKGDSSFIVNEGGKYWVEVTNDKANKLRLYSNPLDVPEGIILPLEWISFTARECSGNACLQWQTENEQNTSHFEIEKSTDGENFSKINTQASRNKSGINTYQTTDLNPWTGLNFYRIKQIDLDGKYTYSSVASVRIDRETALKIIPNPASSFFILQGTQNVNALSIFDTTGRITRQWRNVKNNQQLDINDLPPGMYIIKITENDKESTHKLIKH